MLQSSDFIFGCGTIGSRISKKLSYNLLNKALELNINNFDISSIYGKGLAEKYLSEFANSKKKNLICNIKYGQDLKFDLKTVLINICRLEFLNLIRVLSYKNQNFSIKNIKLIVERYLLDKKIKYKIFFFTPLKYL
jgi:aryl-alcohol dehydrogenase-like predicted oxidoreductase